MQEDHRQSRQALQWWRWQAPLPEGALVAQWGCLCNLFSCRGRVGGWLCLFSCSELVQYQSRKSGWGGGVPSVLFRVRLFIALTFHVAFWVEFGGGGGCCYKTSVVSYIVWITGYFVKVDRLGGKLGWFSNSLVQQNIKKNIFKRNKSWLFSYQQWYHQ